MAKLIIITLLLFASLAHGLGRTINYDELARSFFGTIVTVSECDENDKLIRNTENDKVVLKGVLKDFLED